MRGFLGGVSFGALVAAVGAVAWSLSVPLPQSVEVSVAEPARAPVTDPADSSPVEDVGADPDLVETPPAALDPQVVGDDLTALSEAETAGGARPQVGTTAGSVGDAPGGVGAPAIDIARDAPVTPVDALPAPDAPGQEQDLVVSTEPAQPPAPTSPTQDQNPLGEPRRNHGQQAPARRSLIHRHHQRHLMALRVRRPCPRRMWQAAPPVWPRLILAVRAWALRPVRPRRRFCPARASPHLNRWAPRHQR